MSEMGIRGPMLVKDVMTSPVITTGEEESIQKVAKLMEQRKIGCVIITGKRGKPVGVITEENLVKVLVSNVRPSEVAAKEAMTSPVITVDPEEYLSEAARRMSRLNIRRLGVVYKGKLVGIISSKDILAVMPELIETIQEKARIERGTETEETFEHPPLAGYCDECGQWSDSLLEAEGSFLCEDCRVELTNEY